MTSTTTTDTIGSANDLLAAHFTLVSRIKQEQQDNRRQLDLLKEPPLDLLSLPCIDDEDDDLPPDVPNGEDYYDDGGEDDDAAAVMGSPDVNGSPTMSSTGVAGESAPALNGHGTHQQLVRKDLPPAKQARVARYKNYVPEEETIRNDYSQRYVDGGEWPQNWVLGAEPEHRFEEYVFSPFTFYYLSNCSGIQNNNVC
jgi:mRNA m6A methyltransferase non-catalytic subunit